MYTEFYDALNAYVRFEANNKGEREKFAYELHTFLRVDETRGEIIRKGAELQELKGDL